jgi:hypothetical protein
MKKGERALILLLTALAAVVATRHVHAADNGAWRTFIRPVEFTDLLATEDEVWGTTAEGGLLRWMPGPDSFQVIRREPGSIGGNRLTRVALDRSGRLWVGTRAAGANRRDPISGRWDVVTRLDGLPSDSVTVLETQGDTLWIGTTQGVALWNGREVAGALPDGFTVSFDTTFTSDRITGVAVIGDQLWLATPRGAGWAHISSLLTDWRPANAGLSSTEIGDLASDGTDLFARAGTTVHRYRFDLDAWVVQSDAGAARNLEDDGGVVLAAAPAGIARWRPAPSDTGWVRVADGVAIAANREDPEPTLSPLGTLFVAAADTLYEREGSSWTRHGTAPGPIVNDLLHLAVDGPRLYVTSPGFGFSRYDGTAWRWWPPRVCQLPACDPDTTFLQPGNAFIVQVGYRGTKWIGGWSPPPYLGRFAPTGYLATLEDFGDTQAFEYKVVVEDISQTDRMVRTWLQPGARDSNGTMWFGSETPAKGDVEPLGLSAYDSSRVYLGGWNESNSSMSGRFVRGAAVSRNGRLWIGYDGQGLDYVAIPPALQGPNPDGFAHVGQTSNLAVRGVAAYGDSVWILTNTELRLYRAENPTSAVRVFPSRGGQAVLAFAPLAIGRDGTVWAGTTSGLRAWHPSGAQDSFSTVNSPLPNDEVRALAVDPRSGVLWITTAGGLARLDPSFVPPAEEEIPSLTVRVAPNPATLTALGLGLRLFGDADSYEGEIFDLSGRRLRRFRISANGQAIWDGKDGQGHPVKPGLYFVRAAAGGRHAQARVIVLR